MIKPKCLSSIPSHKVRLLRGGSLSEDVCLLPIWVETQPLILRQESVITDKGVVPSEPYVITMSIRESPAPHRLESCWYTGHRGWGSCSLEVTEPSTLTLPTSQSGASWTGNTSLVSPQCGRGHWESGCISSASRWIHHQLLYCTRSASNSTQNSNLLQFSWTGWQFVGNLALFSEGK